MRWLIMSMCLWAQSVSADQALLSGLVDQANATEGRVKFVHRASWSDKRQDNTPCQEKDFTAGVKACIGFYGYSRGQFLYVFNTRRGTNPGPYMFSGIQHHIAYMNQLSRDGDVIAAIEEISVWIDTLKYNLR